jgi:glycosyltransferase involved in cell wall biosynthesis
MRILFVTSLPYLPQSHGGMQSSTNELCICLKDRAHHVAVLASLNSAGVVGWKSRIKMHINKRLSGCKVSRDSAAEYPVWRTSSPWDALNHVVGKENPDVIVVLVASEPVRIALAARRTEIPILLRLLDVEFHVHSGSLADLGNISCIANSHFTAGKYRTRFGANPSVIYPLISPDRYRTETTRQNVTFINPQHCKGFDIALGVARLCAEIPFAFVESWPLSGEQRRQLMQKCSAIPNVTLLPPRNDMRTVYGKCRILLAPSVWEEAYGRVASEAQISGIPVVASSRGGLPEAVGPGGILLDPQQPVADWASAIRELWQDQRWYSELCAAAVAHAGRFEMTLAYQMDAWERAMLAASGQGSRASAHRNLGS